MEMEQTEKREEIPYSEILVTLGDILDPRIRGEIATGRRQIAARTYEDEPLPSKELEMEAQRYDLEIMEEIEREISEKQGVVLTMFTCMNGNAADIQNKGSEIIPKTFDKNQVFIQRFALLRKIFREAEKQDIRVTLNVIIGDIDFLTDYYPTIERSEVDINLEQYFSNAQMYRDDLTENLRKVFYENGISADIFNFGDQDVTTLSLDEAVPTKSSINVMSLLLNTANWGTEEIGEGEIDERDILEEAFYTSRRCNSERFDPNVFAGLPIDAYEQIARIKACGYRKQGEIVKRIGGKILLMDELPPALKTRFLAKNPSDLLFIFPWIREEDAWKNQNLVEMEKVNRVKRL